MATHRIHFPHLTERDPVQPAAAGQALTRPEPNFWLFMMAPVTIALTVLTISLISLRSF